MRQLITPFIAINSFVEQKVDAIEIPRPDVGLRWGGTSGFEAYTKRPRLGVEFSVNSPDDRKPREAYKIFPFEGEATTYTVTQDENSPLTGVVRYTSKLQFVGVVTFEQYIEDRRQLPLDVTYKFIFHLTLNE